MAPDIDIERVIMNSADYIFLAVIMTVDIPLTQWLLFQAGDIAFESTAFGPTVIRIDLRLAYFKALMAIKSLILILLCFQLGAYLSDWRGTE